MKDLYLIIFNVNKDYLLSSTAAIHTYKKKPFSLHPLQVYAIALDYGMELLIQSLKLGIIKQGALHVLEEQEKSFTGGVPQCDVLYDAFAEYSQLELKSLEGYNNLHASTKLDLAHRRINILEDQLKKEYMRQAQR